MNREKKEEGMKGNPTSQIKGEPQSGEVDTGQLWVPPDGGYGWVIVLVCFIGIVLNACYAQLGIFMVEFSSHFNVSLAVFGWLNATQTVPGRLLGIFLGPLVARFSCRVVMLVGVLLTSTGFLCAAFVTSVHLQYIFFGLIPSIGIGCITCAALVAPQQFFDKKRSIACGIVLAGVSFGFFIWPPLATILIAKLGYKLTLVTEAAIIFGLGCFSSALLRSSGNRGNMQSQNKLKATDDSKDVEEVDIQRSNLHNPRPTLAKKLYSNIKCIVDVRPLKIATVAVFLCGTLLGNLGHQINLVYTPARSKLFGIDDQEAALHGSVMGITSGVMAFVFAVIGNISGCKSRAVMYFVGQTSVGILSFVSVACSTSAHYFGYVVISGIMQGLFLGVEQPLMGDLCGRDLVPATAGWYMAQLGVAHLTMHPVTGLLLDTSGDPNSPFYLAGVSQTLGGLALAYIPWAVYRKSRSVVLSHEPSQGDFSCRNPTFNMTD